MVWYGVSILYKKQFLVIGNKQRGLSRFTDLLNNLGLMSRLLLNDDNLNSKVQTTIDYDQVDILLTNKILSSKKKFYPPKIFLKNIRNMKYANVTVIIPCYKSKGTVRRAVESVYNQTLLPKEVVLVDDYSPDNTLDILKEIQLTYPSDWIKVVSLKHNVGAGSARNRGWDISTQDYIAFLDSDDSWHPQKIEFQYMWMRNNLHAALSTHRSLQVENANSTIEEIDLDIALQSVKKINKHKLLTSNVISTSTVMLRSKLPYRFEENKRYSEDYQLWLEIAFSGNECFISEEKLTRSYKNSYGEAGLSASLWKMEKGELDTYKRLWKKNLISFFQMIFFQKLSILKFLGRIVNVSIRS